MEQPSQFSLPDFYFENLIRENLAKEEILARVSHNSEEVTALKKQSYPLLEVRLFRFEPEKEDYKLIAVRHLYDLRCRELIDIASVGRAKTNDLIARLDNEGEVDLIVSRRHGLVALRGREVFYIDLGNFEDGSKNGTRVNDDKRYKIRNRTIRWNKLDFLTIGDRIEIPGPVRKVSRFKLEYSWL